ncbi:MAG TPA: hypothetical protein VNH18_11650, partial [Bryobacteraceae bacterium]|nr:hypothetical protein [Bryobacteraceae bacterium]
MKKLLVAAVVAVPALLSVVFAATRDFMPDWQFKGASLNGWHLLGHADWRASGGEITGTPRDSDGGWLVLDKGFQDVQLHS